MSQAEQLKLKIIETGKRLYDRGYLIATSGNISARLPDGNVLITASQTRKYNLHEDDICTCRPDGSMIDGDKKKSSEYRLHFNFYNQRSDVAAIVHAHPPHSIAASLATITFDYPILPETALTLGVIPTIPYISPGSQELADALMPHIKEHNAFILKRHGVFAIGTNLDEAFDRLEMVEHTAQIAYMLSLKGRIPLLGREQLSNLIDLAKSQGIYIPQMVEQFFARLFSK